MASLFQRGIFRFSSGQLSTWKVECDKATDEDIETLAFLGIEDIVGGFSEVIPVPKGKSGSPIDNAERIAKVLRPLAVPTNIHLPILIVDDVLTTGDSIEATKRHIGRQDAMGLVLFSHTTPPPWVKAVWILGV